MLRAVLVGMLSETENLAETCWTAAPASAIESKNRQQGL